MASQSLSAELISCFAKFVGEANALTRPDDQAPYLLEWRDRYSGKTPVVLRPASTEQISQILALAYAENVGVVPQGGNTGLVGGQIPSSDNHQIVLSLSRLKGVRDVDAAGGTMIVEAGVTLAEAQNIAADADKLFPLSLAAEGTAQIGGVLATNAGGTAVLAYGNARSLCLGIEAVLADGRVWNGLRRLKKDNTGYDLRDLLIGSEGTLAIITAATLKLFPQPAYRETAIVGLGTREAILELFRRVEKAAGPALTAFEFWCRRAQEFALAYVPGTRDPLEAGHLWYALIEISHATDGARVLDDVLADAIDKGEARDAVVAQSLQQARDFWRLRESLSEAQKGAGGSIKHDVSIPIAHIPDFLIRAGAVVEKVCPGARPVPFGHFGDGNIHYNVSQPLETDKDKFLALWEPMSEAIHDLVHDMGGSISAEHGIGQMKRDALRRYKSPVELDMMRAIKAALDPKGILNPGKLL